MLYTKEKNILFFRCVCETGYIGDGQNCYGNILQVRYVTTNTLIIRIKLVEQCSRVHSCSSIAV